MNDSVAVSLISAFSGIVVAYIVNVAAKRVQARKVGQGPVDRMEQMFDGYERLIKQKDIEDEIELTVTHCILFERKNSRCDIAPGVLLLS